MRADFGTACLKKAINNPESANAKPVAGNSNSAQPQSAQQPKRPTPGRTRYFSVKPMVNVARKTNQFGIKSPALNGMIFCKNIPKYCANFDSTSVHDKREVAERGKIEMLRCTTFKCQSDFKNRKIVA